MKIEFKDRCCCTLNFFLLFVFLLLTVSRTSYANEHSISEYILHNNFLKNIRIGWVTIDLSTDNPVLTNDQRITLSPDHNPDDYVLSREDFIELVDFFFNFTSDWRNGNNAAISNDELVEQMTGFVTRIFYLNASNLDDRSFSIVQERNRDFYNEIDLQRSRRQTSSFIGYSQFYSNTEYYLPKVNIELLLLVASFLRPWFYIFPDSDSNVVMISADFMEEVNKFQFLYFFRVFHYFLQSRDGRSEEYQHNSFTFMSGERLTHFLYSVRRERNFIFATLLYSLSVGLFHHLVDRSTVSINRISSPENVFSDFLGAGSIQNFFRGYANAYLRSRHGAQIPFFRPFTPEESERITVSWQLALGFTANLALTETLLGTMSSGWVTDLLFRRHVQLTNNAASDGARWPADEAGADRATALPSVNSFSGGSFRVNEEVNRESDRCAGICTVCMETGNLQALVPCGHVCMCSKCIEKIQKSDNNCCPHCRKGIQLAIKLYFD
ncbi:RING-HC finger protein [Endozoicomonas euniceicola]|uniref:RING-HC finger protein n=1 Tax=Endozoicomonas euniceicola TaxID=1234143 RepID=A0ABY6GVQ0_9GAMM|nr:RING-HC finger protein [Endozoicomonas euniceicola]UYM16479.1 RING-HC finger protein [Endozoicomonas euniceicola]